MNPFDQQSGTTATSVAFVPSGNIVATTVKAAIEELDNEKDTIEIRDVEFPSSGTMSASNVYKKRHTNLGQTLDTIMTYNAGADGQSGEVSIVTTVAKYFRLAPPAGAAFMLDGEVLNADQTVQVASAAEGSRIDWDVVKIAASTWRIRLWTVSGPWAKV